MTTRSIKSIFKKVFHTYARKLRVWVEVGNDSYCYVLQAQVIDAQPEMYSSIAFLSGTETEYNYTFRGAFPARRPIAQS